MIKHTAAPWKYNPEDGEIYMDDGDVQALIATVNLECVSEEQGNADGQLIAAAPELLDVVKVILSTVGTGAFWPALERAKKIVQKAESQA